MSHKYTLEEIQNKIDLLFPTENLTVLEYSSMAEPIVIHCNNCNTTFSHSTGRSYLGRKRSCGCAHCSSESAKKHQEILKAIEEKYEILEIFYKPYQNKNIRYVKIKCKNCSHIRDSRFSTFLQSPYCGCEENSRYASRTKEDFLREINKTSQEGEYELLSDYIDTKTKVRLRHNCGFIWNVRPNALLKSHTAFCPRCGRVESKGARAVASVLESLDIDFLREKTLDNSLCRFDFYFELNGNKYAIEYNGRQHYEYVPHFTRTEEDFQALKDRDKFKTEYCKQKNIKLLVIPYTLQKEDIQKVIQNFVGSTTISNE